MLLWLIIQPSALQAQELFVGAGVSRHIDAGTEKAIWSISYLEELSEHLAFSITYLNEGHQPDHHRDGLAPQVWGRTRIMGNRLSLGAAVGVYGYCDSDLSPPGFGYINEHGIGFISSMAATWYGYSPWLFQLRGNYIVTSHSFDTLSATLGIGYQLDAPSAAGAVSKPYDKNAKGAEHEITLFLGAAVPNNSRSDRAFSQSFEYRRHLSCHVEWTAALINEGDSSQVDRYGLASQIWLVRPFFQQRLRLGVGAGPYFVNDRYREEGGKSTLAGIVSLTAAYNIRPEWALRMTWSRVLTDYDRDADVYLAGLSYLF